MGGHASSARQPGIMQFLADRVDEDERVARRAAEEARQPDAWKAAPTCLSDLGVLGLGDVTDGVAVHAARQHPQRTRARARAVRALMEIHRLRDTGDGVDRYQSCHVCRPPDGKHYRPGPCDTLLALTAEHITHHDFARAWTLRAYVHPADDMPGRDGSLAASPGRARPRPDPMSMEQLRRFLEAAIKAPDPDDNNDAGDDQGDDPVEEGDVEFVEKLTPDMTGRWLVTTQGTEHLWDLDRGTYARMPGESSVAGAFDHDGTEHPITRVEWWPRVGGQALVWYDDPENPVFIEQFRRSSRIRSIARLPDVDPERSEVTTQAQDSGPDV